MLLILLLFIGNTAFSQTLFNINGIVKDKQGEPIESATVFLSGSTQVTKTNANGRFSFKGLSSGSYEVVVRMLGYSSLKENALINSTSINKVLILSSTNILLKEVQIGKGRRREEYLHTFFDTFVGVTKNAAFCTILNPEVIEFSTEGSSLKAFSEEFIIILNKSLGYKISYLLRDYKYDRQSTTTIYDGEYIFEKLPGTEIQQRRWEKNRLQTYKGSFMHYLRSLYVGNTRGESFLTYVVDQSKRPTDSLVDVRKYVSRANSNFINFRFNTQLKVVYVGKAKARKMLMIDPDPFKLASMPTSNAILFVDQAVIDKKGSYIDYKSFRLEGMWGVFRLGDQLPFEYRPK
ncbi:MAG: carboxypeptidase-like regulatory domain-containing protein [Pedobacter sp.]